MITKNSLKIEGSAGRPILIDVTYKDTDDAKPVIIFCHGFKGYKDWGAFPLMAEFFAEAGYVFIKFNFSHNGGTVEQPIDFPDLKAFGENNYSIELDDLGLVIDDVISGNIISLNHVDLNKICLLGHSRGGGIAILKASEDTRINKLATLAAVSDFKSRFPIGPELLKWDQAGTSYVLNGRTGQQMPMNYQLYENFVKNEHRLTISSAAKGLDIPYAIIHGTDDQTVLPKEAENLNKWSASSQLKLIESAGHTFGAKHPWDKNELPDDFKTSLMYVIDFFNA